MRISACSSDVCSSDLFSGHSERRWNQDGKRTDILDERRQDGHRGYQYGKLPAHPRNGRRKASQHGFDDSRSGYSSAEDQRTTDNDDDVVAEPRKSIDRKSTRLNSSHYCASRMPSSA